MIHCEQDHSEIAELREIAERCSPGGSYVELFARFQRDGWAQWGNEDVEQNSVSGVAMRKGHVRPELRLFQPPLAYRGA